MKEQVVAILLAKKEEKVAAVAAEFDSLISQVQALEEVPSGSEELESLRAKVVELESKNAALTSQLQSVDQLAKQIDQSIEDDPQA